MNDLSNSKILVTGGAGMIGSHIVDLLVFEKVGQIVVYDNLCRGNLANLDGATANGEVRVVIADIRDRIMLNESMIGVDYVFHLAGRRLTRCAAEPRETLEVLFDGTFNVLEAAVEHKVKKVVYASSASIYGMADSFPITEDHHPYNSTSIYGAGKMAGEMMLRSFYNMCDLDYVALRYFNVYGPRMDIHGAYTQVMIRWLDRIDRGGRPVIFGDGEQTMDFVHVKDVSNASVLAMKSDVTDDVFNVATGVEMSLTKLAALMLELTDSDLVPLYKPSTRPETVQRRFGSIVKAIDKLGFVASVPLRAGLAHLIEWHHSMFSTSISA